MKDATGQALGYFYFEEEPRRHSATKLLTRDEGRGLTAHLKYQFLQIMFCALGFSFNQDLLIKMRS